MMDHSETSRHLPDIPATHILGKYHVSFVSEQNKKSLYPRPGMALVQPSPKNSKDAQTSYSQVLLK